MENGDEHVDNIAIDGSSDDPESDYHSKSDAESSRRSSDKNKQDNDDEEEEEEEELHLDEFQDDTGTTQQSGPSESRPSESRLLPLPWTITERQDFEASLEHLVMVGNHFRHMAWRKREWKIRQQHQQQQKLQHGIKTTPGEIPRHQAVASVVVTDAADGDGSSKLTRNNNNGKLNHDTDDVSDDDDDDDSDIPDWQSRLLHAEDVRIYGKQNSGYADIPWPIPLTDQYKIEKETSSSLPTMRVRRRYRDATACDSQWDIEHGDGINPILFHKMRLSKRQRVMVVTEQDGQQQQQPELPPQQNVSTSPKQPPISFQDLYNPTVLESNVPRALISRCWERAVHAASCTMACPVTSSTTAAELNPAVETTDRHSPQQQQPGNELKSTRVSYSSHAAIEKCQDLQIPLPPSLSSSSPSSIAADNIATTITSSAAVAQQQLPLTCPSCRLAFDPPNHNLLNNHLLGTPTLGGGCIWHLIHEKQHELIQKVLEDEVTLQATALLRLIFATAEQEDVKRKQQRAKLADSTTSDNTNQKRSWQTILHCLQSTLDRSKPCTNKSNGEMVAAATATNITTTTQIAPFMAPLPSSLLETLQTETDRLPLVLNHDLLEIVTERLVDRYANVPS